MVALGTFAGCVNWGLAERMACSGSPANSATERNVSPSATVYFTSLEVVQIAVQRPVMVAGVMHRMYRGWSHQRWRLRRGRPKRSSTHSLYS